MITISQWAGLATNASPYGLPPGATVEQVNLQCLSPGKLTVRRGIVSDPMNGGSPIVQIFLHYNRNVATVIYQRADGTVAFRGGVDSTAPSPPLSVALQSSPGTPTQLALATAPLPPTGISVGNQSGAPSGVTLTVAPRSPTSLLLKTAPTAPPTVGTLSAPRNLTATLDVSAPGQPTNLELATVPSNPYGLTLAFAPGEPYGVTVQAAPTPPSGVSLTTGPDAPTNVTAVGPIPDPYMGLVVLLLQDQATDESPAGQTLIFNGSSSITSSLSKVGSKSFFTTNGSYPTNMVEVANSGDLFADRDWTVEMWVRRTTASDTTYLWSTGTASGALNFLINGERITMSRPNNVYLDSGALTWSADQWYHIAGVRSGNTVMAFRDGVLVATGSFSEPYAAINDLNYAFGAQSATHDAYFDSVRVTDGYARYTSAGFTPPLAPYTIGPPIAPTGVTLAKIPTAPTIVSAQPSEVDPYASSVVLLLQDKETDDSQAGQTITYTNASFTNSLSKVGDYSLHVETGGSAVYPQSGTLFADRDFTVEAWVLLPNYDTTGLYNFFRCTGTGPRFMLINQILRVTRPNNAFVVSADLTLSPNVWHHVAYTRRDNGSGQSDYYEIFLDGVSVASATRIEVWAGTPDYETSADSGGEFYIDQLRVTDGVARYTGNFTPPTRADST